MRAETQSNRPLGKIALCLLSLFFVIQMCPCIEEPASPVAFVVSSAHAAAPRRPKKPPVVKQKPKSSGSVTYKGKPKIPKTHPKPKTKVKSKALANYAGVSRLRKSNRPEALKSRFNVQSRPRFNSSSSNLVNSELKKRGDRRPYKRDSKVFTLKTRNSGSFIRVYDGKNSKLKGRWIMRERDLRAPNGKWLSAKEIQKKFALPNKPRYVGRVDVSSGAALRFGLVGKNFGHSGGGKQYELIETSSKAKFKKIGSLQ